MTTPPDIQTITRTLRFKVKREAYPWLEAAAREVNFVWNYCNETSLLAATRTDRARKWLSGFDLCRLTAGATACFDRIGSGTIQEVCQQYAQKRRTAKRLRLKWRASGGSGRALGWVPFKVGNAGLKGKALRFCGKSFRVFEPARLSDAQFRGGCFAQDSVGDWWLCLSVNSESTIEPAEREVVGIDLGLTAIATTSDGDTLEAGRWTGRHAVKLADAQRRGHKRQAKRIHRKIARQRQDALHKFSRRIVNQYQNIIVGDVSSSRLALTRMSKSVLDSGWSALKTQLHYKGQQAGRNVQIVNERNTTRACSNCGQLTGPRGLRQLVERQWTCECGATHDRDVNAVKNIARLRREPPFAGTSLRREVMA